MRKIFLVFILGMFLISCVSAATWNASMENGVVLAWNLNETSGTTAVDLSGNGYDGTANTDAVFTTSIDGVIDTAADFTGGNNYISRSEAAGVQALSGVARTLCFAAETTDFSANGMFFNSDESELAISAGTNAAEILFGANTNGNPDAGRKGISYAGMNTNQFYHYCVVIDGSNHISAVYVNGSSKALTVDNSWGLDSGTVVGARNDDAEETFLNGYVDEVVVWNRSLSQNEVTAVYEAILSGDGYGSASGGGVPTTFTITLNSPSNATVISDKIYNFTATYNISDSSANWTNASYFVWRSNGTIFNNSVSVVINGTDNQTTEEINGFNVGSYLWNVRACYTNATGDYCNWSLNNYTLDVGASIISHTYSNSTWETNDENFILGIELLNGSEISLAQLVYNGTNYTISNVTASSTNATLTLNIDIPLNVHLFQNQTNDFYYRFIYEGSQVQETSIYQQNSSFINLQKCNATYNTMALNMTLIDEYLQTAINPANNPTDFQASFFYWMGSGGVYKNYSYSLINSNTIANYSFCIMPHYNQTYYSTYGLMANMSALYSADDYSEREYFLNNASLTNVTSNLNLYLLNDSAAVKFTFTVKQGTSFLQDAYITISKYFIGDGVYKTVAIRKTDDSGQFVEYLELDRDYRYSIVKDGLLGVIERKSACSTAPCEETLQVADSQGSIWSSYSDVYAANVLSNLTYNQSTKIVTYSFIDTTGLANYFRLQVSRGYLNQSSELICNEYSYSSSGTLTCNMSGYNGDFVATTYISRSPEKVDQFISFFIGELKESLGTYALFISFAIIVTLVFAGAAISGGNPAVILFMLGLAILITKIMTLFPYSWGVVALLELLIIFLISKVRT